MPKFIDITEQQFGIWRVIKYTGNQKWLCECQCKDKTRREVLGKTLRNGKSKSCGCLNRTNIDDKIFGNWYVIKQLNYYEAQCKCLLCEEIYTVKLSNIKTGKSNQCAKCSSKNKKYDYEDLSTKMFGKWKPITYEGHQKWLCECQCENKTQRIVHAEDLKRGKTTSCGCLQFKDLKKQNVKATVIKYIGNGYWECECNNCCKRYITHRTYILNGKEDCGCLTSKRRLNTLVDRYGDFSTSKINQPRTLEQQQAVLSKENIIMFIHERFDYKPTIYEASIELGISADRVLKLAHKYKVEDNFNIGNGSRFEEEIYKKLLDITQDINIIRHDRTVLNPKELDIYIPEKKLAIEFNGNYWHSSTMVDKYYHQQKTIECAKQGIQLIHIFEYEWVNNRDKIVNLLKNKLNSTESIYARKTTVQLITNEEAKNFCNKVHIQGYVNSIINIGCKYNEELIGVISISKPRFNNKYQYEITRLCWSKNVIGGTEKLFKYFIKNYNPTSIITYTDISKFTGNVYTRIGFKLIEPNSITKPNYVWVSRDNKVLTRYQTQKHILVSNGLGDTTQSETEIMSNLNFLKIHDSGNIRLKWLKGEN